MNDRVSGFDWDEGNKSKCQKHGVSIAEIEALFHKSDPLIGEGGQFLGAQMIFWEI